MYFQDILQGIASNLIDSNLFQLKSSCGTFFLGIPYEQFNLGHWSYLFKMWTQEQLRDLTTEKVIEERLTLFQIKQNYERQNVDPPAELLADLELLNEEIKTQFGLIKIILNCITAEFMACIASSMT